MARPSAPESDAAALAAALAGRVRAIDAFRALAVAMVVLGHWAAFALTATDGRLDGDNLLRVWAPAAWLTWAFQVMPVFFVVGGYAGTISWRRSRGHPQPLPWLGARLTRLLGPTALLLVTTAGSAVVLQLAGVDRRWIDLALMVIGLPLWFLAVYVVVVALTPVVVAIVDRWGARVPATLVGACLVVDVLANHLDVPLVGWLNVALFWCAAYAAGSAWRVGSFDRLGRRAWLLVAGGLSSLVLMVTVGPYPVSMLAAPDAELQNSGPPSAALVALAIAQFGLVLLLAPDLERWCARPRVWEVVVRVNLVALSLYLWHMPAAVLAAAGFWATGLVQAAPPLSAAWWLTRPVWLLTCAALLAAITLLVRRVEWRRVVAEPVSSSPLRWTALACGVTLTTAGMLPMALSGIAGSTVPAALGAIAFVLGAWAISRATGVRTRVARADVAG